MKKIFVLFEILLPSPCESNGGPLIMQLLLQNDIKHYVIDMTQSNVPCKATIFLFWMSAPIRFRPRAFFLPFFQLSFYVCFSLALINFSRNLLHVFFIWLPHYKIGSMFFFLKVFFPPPLIRFWIILDLKQRNKHSA